MAEQNAFDRDQMKLQPLVPLAPMGLLEQFNLPPKMIAFIRRNQRTLWLIVSACVILGVAAAGFSTYRERQITKATTALEVALAAEQDKRQMLEKVVQEYGATSPGLWAKIELAFLDEKEGQLVKAIDRLAGVNAEISRGAQLKPLVLTKLAGLYENERQFDKAIALYTELAANKWFAPEGYRALGRVNEQLGKKEEAAAMYGKYLELTSAQPGQGNGDLIRNMVQSRLNQMEK